MSEKIILEVTDYPKGYLTMRELCKITGRSRQSFYLHIKNGKLHAFKKENYYIVPVISYNNWIKTIKYNRNLRVKKDTNSLLFDGETTFSVSQVAEILGCNEQHIYYLLKRGEMECSLHGKTKVITKQNYIDYLNKYGFIAKEISKVN